MFCMRLKSLHCQKNWLWTLSSTEASLCCARARWAPARFLFFQLLLFLNGYPAGASAEERGVWNSLKCHRSPPPNPWGTRLSPPRLKGDGDEWHFRLRMDIFVHSWINKGSIQRKHISLCGSVGKDTTNKPLVFSWSSLTSGLATSLIVAPNQIKQ